MKNKDLRQITIKDLRQKTLDYHKKFITTVALAIAFNPTQNKALTKWMSGLLEKYKDGLLKELSGY